MMRMMIRHRNSPFSVEKGRRVITVKYLVVLYSQANYDPLLVTHEVSQFPTTTCNHSHQYSFSCLHNVMYMIHIIMPLPLIGVGIKRCFCLISDVCLFDVCLSVVYSGRNSRTERPRKTKIGTEVAHVTRNSNSTFKVKRSKVKVTRPLWLVVLSGQHGHTVMVTYHVRT